MTTNALADEDVRAPAEAAQGSYELRDVSRVYRTGGGEVRAVDGVDLTIEPGDFVAIEGPSGSGKTTLLQLLGALDTPTGGTILFDGRSLGGLNDAGRTKLRRIDFGFVFQHFNLIPTLTAAENVEAALATLDGDRRQRRDRAAQLLGQVGLAARADHLPSRLSGGEQQRVAIARALSNHPRVVLADEPTGNLDTGTAEEVMAILGRLSRDRHVTVIVVTHAEDVARRAHRRLRMRDGRIIESLLADSQAPRRTAPRQRVVAAGRSPSRARTRDPWGTCPECGSADPVVDVREHCRCASCGKRFARAKAGERTWKECPSCGGERMPGADSGACPSCDTRRTRNA